MESKGGGARFRFSLKEVLVVIASTALALGSFRSGDPWVVIPMLLISGGAFIALCIWHEGKPVSRICTVILILIALGFIGWRDLRQGAQSASPPQSPTAPAQPSPMINQQATDSECSNLVAGSGAQIKCEAAEKERHAKDKTHP